MLVNIDSYRCDAILGPVSTRRQLPVVVEPCCEPLVEEPIGTDAATELAARLRAIAEPNRLRLLSLIAAAPGGEMCVCDLTAPVGLSQPTVSHHLKVLADAGIVTRDKRGVNVHYAIAPGALDSLAAVLTTPARA